MLNHNMRKKLQLGFELPLKLWYYRLCLARIQENILFGELRIIHITNLVLIGNDVSIQQLLKVEQLG